MAAQEYPKPARKTGGRNIEATGLSAQYVCQRFGVRTKSILFVCLLPQHKEGDYWTDVEDWGMKRAVETFSDFLYYDQYEYSSFII